MRRMVLCGSLLLIGAIAVSILAGGWNGFRHGTNSNVAWRDADHALTLHSGRDDGITVTQARPEAVWGLHQGDEILAVDDHPVRHVDDLLDQLNASKPAAVKLRLRRGEAEQVLMLAAVDYAHLVAPTPSASPSGG